MAKIIMSAVEFAERHLDVARNYKTKYMYACYGWRITDFTIARKSAQNLNGWYTKDHIAGLREVANQQPPTWGFDCVNLPKGILWGWTGDATKDQGGAVHGANGVPDTNANGMILQCRDVTTDFSHIEVGEGLWLEGHWGTYVGNGLAVECTGRWDNGVQITSVWNLGKKEGMNGRYWTKHGKLPWLKYEGVSDDVKPAVIKLGSRTIRKGTQGTDVQELQNALMKLGYRLPKFGADGDCGKETITAIKMFQDDHSLEADGVAGKATLAALLEALNGDQQKSTERTYTIVIYDVPEAEKDAMLTRWPRAEIVRG